LSWALNAKNVGGLPTLPFVKILISESETLENDRFNDDREFTIEELTARAYPRKAETLSVLVPENVMKSLKEIADRRGTTIDALVRLYIGQCLRKDLSDLFKNTVLERTEEILRQHLSSEEEIIGIMQKIRSSYQSRVKNHENRI
jgi:hypothetical protein